MSKVISLDRARLMRRPRHTLSRPSYHDVTDVVWLVQNADVIDAPAMVAIESPRDGGEGWAFSVDEAELVARDMLSLCARIRGEGAEG